MCQVVSPSAELDPREILESCSVRFFKSDSLDAAPSAATAAVLSVGKQV